MSRASHISMMKAKWKYRGLICREGETYDDIYNRVYSATNCELCNLSFDNNTPEMDHDHISGYFRKVLCRSCNASYLRQPKKSYKNNKTGHRLISHRKRGDYYVVTKKRNNQKIAEKEFKNKIDAICYKYILLLKIKSSIII